MKKEVDFSKGVRGKHVGMNLEVLGASKPVWAVCLSPDAADLVRFKLYRIELFQDHDKVRTTNEKGKAEFYPKVWFAPVDVPKKTLGLLKNAA